MTQQSRTRNQSGIDKNLVNKTQISHRRLRESLARIARENAERIATGKPAHPNLGRSR